MRVDHGNEPALLRARREHERNRIASKGGWRELREAARSHAADGRHAGHQLAVDAIEPRRRARDIPLIAASRLDSNDQDAIAIDARVLSVQLLQAANEQSRADQKHERQRNKEEAEPDRSP